jgi:hypothetical protein
MTGHRFATPTVTELTDPRVERVAPADRRGQQPRRTRVESTVTTTTRRRPR